MHIAEMMVLGETDLIMRFAPNCDFVLFRNHKAIVNVLSHYYLESDQMPSLHDYLKLIGAHF